MYVNTMTGDPDAGTHLRVTKTSVPIGGYVFDRFSNRNVVHRAYQNFNVFIPSWVDE